MRIRNINTGQEFEVLPGTIVPNFYEIIADDAQKPVKTNTKPVLDKKEPEPTPEVEPEAEPVEKPVEKPAKKKKTSRKKKGAKNGK